jgi:Tn3 transposase DDE domain-containing protein
MRWRWLLLSPVRLAGGGVSHPRNWNATGHQITDEDLERLSPLQHEHIKMLGNFPFTLPHELVDGQHRQLRELGQAA